MKSTRLRLSLCRNGEVEGNLYLASRVWLERLRQLGQPPRTLLPQDEACNAKVGKAIRLYECKNCVVHAADESKVVVKGLDGYIVAEKNGQLLVCSLKEEQRIKEFGK